MFRAKSRFNLNGFRSDGILASTARDGAIARSPGRWRPRTPDPVARVAPAGMAGRVAGSAQRGAAQHLLAVADQPQALAVGREVDAVAGAGLPHDLRVPGSIVRHPEIVLPREDDNLRIRIDRMAGIV